MRSGEAPTFQNDDQLVFFPVRHVSPTSARMLVELAHELRPAAILIEGPSDYNAQLSELALEHKLPIAIYSFARLSDDTRCGAFYPLSEYCPEWQALSVAWELKTHVEFIDLPWAKMAGLTSESHRYSDRHFLENPYPASLAKNLNVSGFDEVWDVLFELDPDLTPQTYLKRCHQFCYHLRLFSGPETEENAAREEFMIEQIQRVRARVDGPILIVTGGFHSSGLWARWTGQELEPYDLNVVPIFNPDETEPAESPQNPARNMPDVVESGITLTPFTYQRLDRLSGYQSGVQGPAFYEYVWERRKKREPIDGRALLQTIAQNLRAKGQILSTADLVATETFARMLAQLHGRQEIWRFDILDAIESTLVKDTFAYNVHPVVAEARRVFTGIKRGFVSPDASMPALVRSALNELESKELNFPDSGEPRELELNLEDATDLERSRTLHRCRGLGLSGIAYTGGTNFFSRDDVSKLWEMWELVWSAEFDANLIESAVYGADLSVAAAARLLERASKEDLSTAAITALSVDAALMGIQHVALPLLEAVAVAIDDASDVFDLAKGLAHLAFLTRHHELLQSSPTATLPLLHRAYRRSLWLLESLGMVKDRDTELMQIFQVVFSAFQHWMRDSDEENFKGVFSRISDDTGQRPLARGLATGGLFALSFIDVPRIVEIIESFLDPMELAEFLVGLFSLAREAVQRDERLIRLLDDLISSATEDVFLEMIAGLRLAFTFFTPMEKHRIVDILFPPTSSSNTLESEDKGALEVRLLQILSDYGIRKPTVAEVPEAECSGDGSNPTQSPHDLALRQERWRLILGDGAGSGLPDLCGHYARRDQLLDFLYGREYGPSRNTRNADRRGGLGASTLEIPDWINGVHELFPKRTIERLEKDALDRYQIQEIATRPDVLARATPNTTLLKAILRTKHLMNQEVLFIARRIIRHVVEELIQKLAREIETPFYGALNRKRRSLLKIAKNFDAHETIRRNLKNYDPETQRIVVSRPYFFSRIRRQVDKWRIIILVDQSGSMLDSVIHAAVTASIFHKLNQVTSHLVAFDTQVVDLTQDVSDPVETLLNVQLAGGTDIANAMSYAQSLIDQPRKSIVILITDFFEGGPVKHLLGATKALTESGVQVLGLAALDSSAEPHYDREVAAQMVHLGAHVAAMTPGELAHWVAEKIR